MKLKDGKKSQVLDGTCVEDSLDNQMPTLNKLVRNEPVIVLRDIGCSGVIVKRDLVKEEQLIGKIDYYVIIVSATLLKVRFFNIKASTSYFNG